MGPGDKLKAFMQRFIGPKSQQAYRQVQHSVSGKGDVRGVKKRKLMQGLTGDPVKDNEILYGPTPESKFNRPLTVEEQRRGPEKKGELVSYKKKDGTNVITTKRKAKKLERKENRQEKKNKKVKTRKTPDAKF
tara:strand:+ start:4865 stop:5263 length:399 start_codon:yes stop_codon:yes gene_type:complete